MTYNEYSEKMKAERERKAAEFMDMVEVGDFFYSPWGYEQTNIDFYQVTKKTAKTIWLRPVASIVSETGRMTAKEMPARDCFTSNAHVSSEGKRCKMQGYGSEPMVSICDYANAYLWDGKPKSSTSYY